MVMDRVSLEMHEIMLAAHAGVMRQVENLKLGRTPAHGCGVESDWQLNVEGCLGEMALAKYLGVWWPGKGRFRDCDVSNVDVRTATKDHYRLILHKEDPDDRVFYLLTGVNGVYTVRGWILGEDGKNEEWWEDPDTGRPAYFVPQSVLKAGKHTSELLV